jgi:hypothetical protein
MAEGAELQGNVHDGLRFSVRSLIACMIFAIEFGLREKPRWRKLTFMPARQARHLATT